MPPAPSTAMRPSARWWAGTHKRDAGRADAVQTAGRFVLRFISGDGKPSGVRVWRDEHDNTHR